MGRSSRTGIGGKLGKEKAKRRIRGLVLEYSRKVKVR